MPATDFGEVTVSSRPIGEPEIFIAFPAKPELTITEAEEFWSHLMDAIMFARDLAGDAV